VQKLKIVQVLYEIKRKEDKSSQRKKKKKRWAKGAHLITRIHECNSSLNTTQAEYKFRNLFVS
jgi:hypothetical protein